MRTKPATRQPCKPSITILDLMTDPHLLGWAFQGESWSVWRVFLAALFALPMTKAEAEIYLRHTDRHYQNDLAAAVTYAVLVCGRRSGKSRILALIGIFIAVFCDWRPYIAPGAASAAPGEGCSASGAARLRLYSRKHGLRRDRRRDARRSLCGRRRRRVHNICHREHRRPC